MRRAYFDTCIISGLARQDLPEPEQTAANDLWALVNSSALTVCTSTEALGEINKVPEEHRGRHLEQYNRIATLKASTEWLDAGEVFSPSAQDALDKLLQVLPDEIDARHLAHASMHSVPDFVTTDQRTILTHAQMIYEITGVRVWSPVEFWGQVSSGST